MELSMIALEHCKLVLLRKHCRMGARRCRMVLVHCKQTMRRKMVLENMMIGLLALSKLEVDMMMLDLNKIEAQSIHTIDLLQMAPSMLFQIILFALGKKL
jgi:hypothetical protein